MQVYKLRAECLLDVHRLMRTIPFERYEVESTTLPGGVWLPDVTAEITSRLSLDELKAALQGVPDSHVMRETVALKKDYTGERTP